MRGLKEKSCNRLTIMQKVYYESGQLDEYETKVLSFLKRYSTNNIFNAKEFEKKILDRDYDYSKIRSISNDMMGLTKKQDDSISYQFIISGRKIPFIIGVASITICFFILILDLLHNCQAVTTLLF